jgi:hypothetical protein
MDGKAYLIFVNGLTERESYLLSDATVEEFMGIRCIKGRYEHADPKRQAHYMNMTTMRIPIERILFITEYESRQAHQDAVARHYAAYPSDRDR